MTDWCAVLIQTRTPDGHLHTVTHTRYRIDIINSPDDGHMAARNMYRIEINIHEKVLCVKFVIYKDYTEMQCQQNIKFGVIIAFNEAPRSESTAEPNINLYFLLKITKFNKRIIWARHVARRGGTGNAHEIRKKPNNFAGFSAVAMWSYSVALTQRYSQEAIMSAGTER